MSFPLGIHPVGQMLARAASTRGIAVNWAGSGTTTPSAMQLELIERLRPTIWMGMSSYGLQLANLAEARGLNLAARSIETVLCSAEPLSDAKREKLARQWGARVRDTFGMTEAGMMGAEDEAGRGFRIWTDMFLVEVLDPDTHAPVAEGQVGSLVVTPLWTNNVTPFLRWSSGDLVTCCDCFVSRTTARNRTVRCAIFLVLIGGQCGAAQSSGRIRRRPRARGSAQTVVNALASTRSRRARSIQYSTTTWLTARRRNRRRTASAV